MPETDEVYQSTSAPIRISSHRLWSTKDCSVSLSSRLEDQQHNAEECDPEICDSLAAAKAAIYPAAAVCVILLTLFAVGYSLYFTKAVMLPIVGAFLLNFIFSPLVMKMNQFRIPNAVGALIVLGIAMSAIFIALAFAYDPATRWLAAKDQNIAVVKEKLNILQKPLSMIQEVTNQIDQIGSGDIGSSDIETGDIGHTSSGKTSQSDTQSDGVDVRENHTQQNNKTEDQNTQHDEDVQTDAPVIPVEVQQPSISNRIFSTTGDAFAGISLMMVLLFYLLSAGDRGLEKLVELMPTFRDKKRIVELSRAIEKSISDYLLTTTAINFGLGMVVGIGMWALEMPNPILWGAIAMFLNYFPFVGAWVGAAIVFLAAIVSFDSVAYSAWAPAIYLSANLIEANFITPILLGRSVSLHPVWLMIFFVIVAWVWGIGGAIIAIPILAIIKITCDHVEPLMPLGAFLGR